MQIPFSQEDLIREKVALSVYFYSRVTQSSSLSSASFNLCKGPLGRDVQVGGFGIVVTHVTSLLVIFNPVTVFLSLEEEKETG